MTYIEFKEAINILKLYILEFKEIKEDTYSYKNLIIEYSKLKNKVEIKGKIPLEFAKLIDIRYPNWYREILINGYYQGCNLGSLAVDDIYVSELGKWNNYDFKTFALKKKIAKMDLVKRADDYKYIECYDISTIKGLVILIIEFVNY